MRRLHEIFTERFPFDFLKNGMAEGLPGSLINLGNNKMASRTRKAKWNIASSMMAQIVSMACGLIVPQLMLRSFGSELYGATTSIAHFLAYISLIEGGIAGVARAALYKPLADGDVKAISRVYHEISRFFRRIGFVFVIYTAVLACCYRYIAGNSGLEWLFSFSLVIVISISTMGQYFFGISNSILIQSDQRHYVINILSILTVITNTLFIIALTYVGCDILMVKLVSSCIYILRPIALSLYVKGHYRILPSVECAGAKALTQKWTALGQHIAYFLHSNTDVVILTIFADLRTVAVYSVYSMIVVAVRDLTASFYNGLESVFGNMYAKKEMERLNKVFGYYETLISAVAITLYSSTAALIVPFVKLYTMGVTDVNYVTPEFAMMAVLAEMVYTLRAQYHYLSNAANRFKETRAAAYGEAVINILLSIALVFKFGIVGVAAATLAATAFRSIYYAVYISGHILHRSLSMYIRRNVLNGISFALTVMAGNGVVRLVGADSYLKWIICGLLVFLVSLGISVAANLLFYREDMQAILSRFRAGKSVVSRRCL